MDSLLVGVALVVLWIVAILEDREIDSLEKRIRHLEAVIPLDEG